jgi:hypothetical protein
MPRRSTTSPRAPRQQDAPRTPQAAPSDAVHIRIHRHHEHRRDLTRANFAPRDRQVAGRRITNVAGQDRHHRRTYGPPRPASTSAATVHRRTCSFHAKQRRARDIDPRRQRPRPGSATPASRESRSLSLNALRLRGVTIPLVNRRTLVARAQRAGLPFGAGRRADRGLPGGPRPPSSRPSG